MPSASSKNNDYDVEKIVSKRTDGKGRIFYLIKWKGYSTANNTWEPENNVTNCPDMIKIFEAEEAEKNKLNDSDSNTSETRTSNRSTRSGLSPSKTSTNNTDRVSRSSRRSLSTRLQRKRTISDDSYVTEEEDDNENDYVEKKSKRPRKSTSDTDTAPSIDSHDSDILDTTKLDNILDVRRDKKSNTVEYHIQVKKDKKTLWIKSNRLTEDYTQDVIDFLEEKYV